MNLIQMEPPNSSKWGFDIGTGSGGWGNNEAQYYTNRSDNVKVENGFLKLLQKKKIFKAVSIPLLDLKLKGNFL